MGQVLWGCVGEEVVIRIRVVEMDVGFEDSKQSGLFIVPSGKEVPGELTLAGGDTSLNLYDKESIYDHLQSAPDVNGVLHDGTKVTLVECIRTSSGGYNKNGQHYSYANLHPHYVVYGDHHLEPAGKTIVEIRFVVDDASTLFYDFGAFGTVLRPQRFIDEIVNTDRSPKVEIGTSSVILYFSGKSEIFSVDTVLGKVSVSHSPSHDSGSPEGVSLKNTIYVNIAFSEAVTFNTALYRMYALIKYLDLLAGRPQNLVKMNLRVEHEDEHPVYLQVYISLPPNRDAANERRKSHPSDVLLNLVNKPDNYTDVLSNWLDRNHDWQDARQRFSDSFANQRYYTFDRIIGAANMFDILPDSAAPPNVKLSDEMAYVKELCRANFKSLPVSPERDSVLGALGRLGNSNLKQKVRHRSQLLVDIVGEKFPELSLVTDEAVNCRNHYVHGSTPKFDYSNAYEGVVFFTDTLEFVFAASDLIEAGWDVKAWIENGTSTSHSFGLYCFNYKTNLQALKTLIEKTPVK